MPRQTLSPRFTEELRLELPRHPLSTHLQLLCSFCILVFIADRDRPHSCRYWLRRTWQFDKRGLDPKCLTRRDGASPTVLLQLRHLYREPRITFGQEPMRPHRTPLPAACRGVRVMFTTLSRCAVTRILAVYVSAPVVILTTFSLRVNLCPTHHSRRHLVRKVLQRLLPCPLYSLLGC